jgi:hypothetical protein
MIIRGMSFCEAGCVRLCVSMAFICKLSLLILYIWHFSHAFKCFLFLSVLMMTIASVMVPCLCLVFNMRFGYS